PLRDFRKNQPKTPRKTRLTDAPRSWIGGMNRGPTMNGSSLIGSASGFVSAPHVSGPTPRRMAARPIVAMTTAMMGRPMRRRSMRDRPFDVLHAYARPERGLPAILVGDHGRQLDRVPARVEGVDDGRVLLRDVPPADLSGAGDFGVVGVEVFGEQQEPPDSGR